MTCVLAQGGLDPRRPSHTPVRPLEEMTAVECVGVLHYKGTLLIRSRSPLGPYSRAIPRALGGGRFVMSEVPLYNHIASHSHLTVERHS